MKFVLPMIYSAGVISLCTLGAGPATASSERLLYSFPADAVPIGRPDQDSKGAIDQSNLARLLMGVMSTETCRKVVVACAEAGFLERKRTAYGTMLVHTTGKLEDIFGRILRELRSRIQKH